MWPFGKFGIDGLERRGNVERLRLLLRSRDGRKQKGAIDALLRLSANRSDAQTALADELSRWDYPLRQQILAALVDSAEHRRAFLDTFAAIVLPREEEDIGIKEGILALLQGEHPTSAAVIEAIVGALRLTSETTRLGETAASTWFRKPCILTLRTCALSPDDLIEEQLQVLRRGGTSLQVDGSLLVLGVFAPQRPHLLPHLIAAMGYGHATLHETAVWAVSQVGVTAVEALIEALRTPNTWQFPYAIGEELAKSHGWPGTEYWGVRHGAAQALAQFGPTAAKAVPELIVALRETDWRVRDAAATTLGRIGPEAREAVPHLLPLLDDRGQGHILRATVVFALRRIGAGIDCVPALLECGNRLTDNEDETLNNIMSLVVSLDPDSSAVRAFVQRMANSRRVVQVSRHAQILLREL